MLRGCEAAGGWCERSCVARGGRKGVPVCGVGSGGQSVGNVQLLSL